MQSENKDLISSKSTNRYILKRIDEDDIEISKDQRDAIVRALEGNARFIVISDYVIMLNAMKSIDPVKKYYDYEPRDFPEPRRLLTDEERERGISKLEEIRDKFKIN